MIEIIRPAAAPDARAALFDFDGTLSLIRTGWMGVMVPMMVEVLAGLGTRESQDQLRRVIEDFVWRLTGRETIHQMIELARQVELRGGTPLAPLAYKRCYLERLGRVIAGRLEALRSRRCPADDYLVPGARPLLEALHGRGLRLYLASGTDEAFVREEAGLLDITRYFDGGIYGARDEEQSFNKRAVIERILALPDVRGAHLVGFGDGYVEIEEVKRVGGVAVGVATDEPECRLPDEWKRRRLIGVGADYIVANYQEWAELMARIGARL